ncbi:hypothetical protein, partial [Actinobaculum sp. 352]
GNTPGSTSLIGSWSAVPSAKLSSKSMDAGAALSDGRQASIARLEELASALRSTAEDFETTDGTAHATIMDLVNSFLLPLP